MLGLGLTAQSPWCAPRRRPLTVVTACLRERRRTACGLGSKRDVGVNSGRVARLRVVILNRPTVAVSTPGEAWCRYPLGLPEYSDLRQECLDGVDEPCREGDRLLGVGLAGSCRLRSWVLEAVSESTHGAERSPLVVS